MSSSITRNRAETRSSSCSAVASRSSNSRSCSRRRSSVHAVLSFSSNSLILASSALCTHRTHDTRNTHDTHGRSSVESSGNGGEGATYSFSVWSALSLQKRFSTCARMWASFRPCCLPDATLGGVGRGSGAGSGTTTGVWGFSTTGAASTVDLSGSAPCSVCQRRK
jgi:hypothetical protein